MSEPFYVARARISKTSRGRRAELETGEIAEFGVHGAIKEYFRLSGQPDLPLPVDYLVAATGG